jgi:hypothetical protein
MSVEGRGSRVGSRGLRVEGRGLRVEGRVLSVECQGSRVEGRELSIECRVSCIRLKRGPETGSKPAQSLELVLKLAAATGFLLITDLNRLQN